MPSASGSHSSGNERNPERVRVPPCQSKETTAGNSGQRQCSGRTAGATTAAAAAAVTTATATTAAAAAAATATAAAATAAVNTAAEQQTAAGKTIHRKISAGGSEWNASNGSG
jgi:hypothetical protein